MSLLADLQDYAFNATFLLLNDLEDVVRQYLKDVKAKVLHMKKVSAIQNESMLAPIVIYLFKLSRLPLVILYYVYIMPFLFISRKVLIYFTLAVKIICRRSPPARHIVEHIIALYYICRSVVAKVLTSKLTELIAFCITTIFEVRSSFYGLFAIVLTELPLLNCVCYFRSSWLFCGQVTQPLRRKACLWHFLSKNSQNFWRTKKWTPTVKKVLDPILRNTTVCVECTTTFPQILSRRPFASIVRCRWLTCNLLLVDVQGPIWFQPIRPGAASLTTKVWIHRLLFLRHRSRGQM